MQETTPELQETKADAAKRWFQDNLRIIVSVIIVVAIAGGIYSYSKRTENLATVEEDSQQQAGNEEQGTVEVEGAQEGQQVAGTETQKAAEEVQAPASKETEASFVETAAKGDGVTHLARRSLANYIEKNSDSTLTKEHKIYIEDYLRKNVGFQERVHPGTTIEFSKDLIKNAIEQSKKLNEKQLQNLQKYSAMVPSLS